MDFKHAFVYWENNKLKMKISCKQFNTYFLNKWLVKRAWTLMFNQVRSRCFSSFVCFNLFLICYHLLSVPIFIRFYIHHSRDPHVVNFRPQIHFFFFYLFFMVICQFFLQRQPLEVFYLKWCS